MWGPSLECVGYSRVANVGSRQLYLTRKLANKKVKGKVRVRRSQSISKTRKTQQPTRRNRRFLHANRDNDRTYEGVGARQQTANAR